MDHDQENELARAFERQLREESGHRYGCPICGSRAYEDGECQDCGLDLSQPIAIHLPWAGPSPLWTGYYFGGH